MASFALAVTETELKELTTYAKQHFGGLSKLGLQSTKHSITELREGAYVATRIISITQPKELEDGTIYFKTGGHYSNPRRPTDKLNIASNAECIIVKDDGTKSKINHSTLTSPYGKFLSKACEIINKRDVLKSETVLVSASRFATECNALLKRFYLIDAGVDSINSTALAVFKHCLGLNQTSHKAKHWCKHLAEDHTIRDSYDDIREAMGRVMEKNPSFYHQTEECLRRGYISLKEAEKITMIIEASIVKSSISLKDISWDLSLNEIENGTTTTFTGQLMGFSHVSVKGKNQFELKFKTDDERYVVLTSGSENFRGITKEQFIQYVKEKTPLTIDAKVVNSLKGISVGERSVLPPTTICTATMIRPSVMPENHTQDTRPKTSRFSR